jgi:uncharacterized protein (TIGR02391 family)
VDPTATKWKRLFNALSSRQNKDGHGDRILAFVHTALDPARYAGKRDVAEMRRRAANVPLAFYGLEYGEDGKFRTCNPAETLSEAEQRADRLRAALERRTVDPDILLYCRAELLTDNYFHAVLEATKSVASSIRARTGLTSDGAPLVQEAFAGDQPRLRINKFITETDKGEQRGFVNLLVGFFGTFRNPHAHAARVEWPIDERDALDLLSLASYLHRRIKTANPE